MPRENDNNLFNDLTSLRKNPRDSGRGDRVKIEIARPFSGHEYAINKYVCICMHTEVIGMSLVLKVWEPDGI